MGTRDAIVGAACDALAEAGVGSLTVGRVARRARVSSALVHYHFATKGRLLAAAAAALATRRTDARVSALEAASGVAGLDALWATLATGGSGRAERAWPDLVLLARADGAVRAALAADRERARAALGAAARGLLESLGARPALATEDLADVVCTFLDGIATSLVAGAAREEVRASFDAFWLALVALGQPLSRGR
jgi:AcrR family transcriptional regulator